MQKQMDQAQATESHNFIWEMIRLLESRARVLKPGLIYFHVEHDPWCGIFKNQFCNCDPVIEMQRPVVDCLQLETSKSRERFISLLRKGS